MRIIRTGTFDRMLEVLAIEDPEAFELAQVQVKLFWKNPRDTRLNAHPLRKRMKGKWAFRVTDDVRVVYEWLGKSTVRFLAIGGHEDVYSRKR